MAFLSDIGGRKFIFAVLVTVLGFILVLSGALPAKEWALFATTVGGIYVIGNVTESINGSKT